MRRALAPLTTQGTTQRSWCDRCWVAAGAAKPWGWYSSCLASHRDERTRKGPDFSPPSNPSRLARALSLGCDPWFLWVHARASSPRVGRCHVRAFSYRHAGVRPYDSHSVAGHCRVGRSRRCLLRRNTREPSRPLSRG